VKIKNIVRVIGVIYRSIAQFLRGVQSLTSPLSPKKSRPKSSVTAVANLVASRHHRHDRVTCDPETSPVSPKRYPCRHHSLKVLPSGNSTSLQTYTDFFRLSLRRTRERAF